MLARALHLNGILVSHCRHQGVFIGQYADHDTEDSEESPFAFWLVQEQLHRYDTPGIWSTLLIPLMTEHFLLTYADLHFQSYALMHT